jgi:hypothetical protein
VPYQLPELSVSYLAILDGSSNLIRLLRALNRLKVRLYAGVRAKRAGHLKTAFTTVWLTAIVLATSSVAGNEAANAPAQNKRETQKETHWSLKPVTRPTIPAPVQSKSKVKPRNPVDNFIFAKLAENKLTPSSEAPRRILIRRLYFDLTGLPPTPDEVRAFQRDRSPNAYEKIVERLLASSQYGERWARHWLDIVRFAETHGFEMNNPRPTAYLYRDYIIRAFNDDKPYDRFIVEQFAGDLLNEDAATGFLVGGAWDQVKSPDPVLTAAQRADELHDMVSTTGSAFLGLTVGCARCHNHKFDPVPQVDYYAIKACLAGVQHGERSLRTSDVVEREKEAESCRKQLATIESKLSSYEPVAFTGQMLLVEPEPPAFGSHATELLHGATRSTFPAGTERGQRDDPGTLNRLPTVSRTFLVWSNAANANVFAYEPRLSGKFHIWLSWSCGSKTNSKDVHYLVDKDGDLATTEDQSEITRIDQQKFADGSGEPTDKKLWSGFYDAGVCDLSVSNKILIRGGSTDALVSAGVLAVIEEQPNRTSHNILRASVNPRRNTEHFPEVKAKRLRFTVLKTTDAEPCIDELEIYTSGAAPTNVALASAGTKATASSVFPNSDIHRLEHINDGKTGNTRSWISNERGKGWVELEFPQEVTIDRIVWGRDREKQFSDRLSLDYRIEVATASDDWRVVASSRDRLPYVAERGPMIAVSANGCSEADTKALEKLLMEQSELERRIKQLNSAPMVYAGKFSEKPDPIRRFQRGDPMQEREVVQPAGLSAIPVQFCLTNTTIACSETESSEISKSQLTPDQQRRLALAKWIADPANPLPSRVMVNRLWQHHFGEGLVSTPSDFGKNGARPSHPELLDWLAAEFVSPGTKATSSEPAPKPWSLKHIHRLIVTSASYRQSSAFRPEGISVDASSRLLWRFPPQRLEAEPLRDTILSVSGKLEQTPGGPGFSPFEPNDNYVRVYNPKKEFGPLEWRRMVYMTKVRMQQDSTFGAFDCPDGGQIAPKRMRSTTPLQALNLLNSEFMVQQSEFFAERLKREAGPKAKAQIRLAFELAFNREPASDELKAGETIIEQQGLPLFCRALFNSNEFIFVE